ncbi:MAG: hypothetical protein KatS3mg064_0169 [Tepidiforma sp.]|nr:MAG: hypothetical protein KatS3mg064_0169 [Tepidiforma sp.]
MRNFTVGRTTCPEPIDYARGGGASRQVTPIRARRASSQAGAGGAGILHLRLRGDGRGAGDPAAGSQLTEMARAKEADFNLVGPNCMGLYLPPCRRAVQGRRPGGTDDGRHRLPEPVRHARHHVQPRCGRERHVHQQVRVDRQRHRARRLGLPRVPDARRRDEGHRHVRGGREGRAPLLRDAEGGLPAEAGRRLEGRSDGGGRAGDDVAHGLAGRAAGGVGRDDAPVRRHHDEQPR